MCMHPFIVNSHMQTCTHYGMLPPPRSVTSSTFPEARLRALCHFHHERVSCETTNFSPFNFGSSQQMHSFFRAGHEYFRAEWQIQWRMKREKEWVRREGRSREVWVIIFGFADLINDLSPADFNQTTLVLSSSSIAICDFSRSAFPSPLLSVWHLTSLSWTEKNFNGGWAQLYCLPVGVRG